MIADIILLIIIDTLLLLMILHTPLLMPLRQIIDIIDIIITPLRLIRRHY
jgi:hypothetical protein